MIKAVVFDIGNVLMEWHPDKVYGELIPDVARRKAIFEEVGLDEMNLDVDRGAPFKETIYAKADAFPQYGDLIRAWHDRWIEMAQPLIPKSWEILRKLKSQGMPVFALSNFGVESYEYAKSVYPELDEFDVEFISGRLRMIKPDIGIYAHLEEETGLSGADLVFFDDRLDNIEAAQKRGWHGFVFTSPDQMAIDLKGLGLSV